MSFILRFGQTGNLIFLHDDFFMLSVLNSILFYLIELACFMLWVEYYQTINFYVKALKIFWY